MAGIQAIVAFAETVKQGGFARAGRELGLSASAVAKSVARLEADLGLRLLHRTTRQVTLTSDGQELYARCERVVAELEALRANAEGVRGEPSGTLRLNAPTTYGKRVLMPILARMASTYPKLNLELSLSDRYVDVIRDGLDAVVRIAVLADSSLIARPLDWQQLVTVGAPAYLAAHGTPERPEDLSRHVCLAFRLPASGRLRPWQFREGRRDIELPPSARFVIDEGEALVGAAVAGLGLVQAPSYMARDELVSGHLVEVLAGYRPPPMPISLVYPSNRYVTPRLRALIAAVGEIEGRSATA